MTHRRVVLLAVGALMVPLLAGCFGALRVAVYTSNRAPVVGSSVTISAEALNFGAGRSLTIWQDGVEVKRCADIICTYDVRFDVAGEHRFFAGAGDTSFGERRSARSSDVVVTWVLPAEAHSVSLETSSISNPIGSEVTLTASSARDVGPTPYYIVISEESSSSSLTVASCGSGKICFAKVRSDEPDWRRYRARIVSADRSDVRAQTGLITVMWDEDPDEPTTTTTQPPSDPGQPPDPGHPPVP